MVENNTLLGALFPTRPIERPGYAPDQRPNQQQNTPTREDIGAATGRIARSTALAPLNFAPDNRSLEYSVEQARVSQQQGKPIERGSILNLII